MIRAKCNTCLNNTNLGYVTGVNGKNSATTPPPTEHRIMTNSATTPPPTESIRAKLGLPPQMDVGPYAYEEADILIAQHAISYLLLCSCCVRRQRRVCPTRSLLQ